MHPNTTCQHCGKSFYARPNQLARGEAKFCAYACFQAHRMSSSKGTEGRFWSHVLKPSPDACWEWQAARDRKGYGRFGLTPAVAVFAHRYSMSLHLGRNVGDEFVCHTCDNPSCVNPAHLFVGTSQDNLRDMHRKGRGSRSKLTLELANEIRAKKQQGASATALALEYGVSSKQIHHIVAGKSWANY